MSQNYTIEQYSERAIVVRGNTEPIKDMLLDLGGKYNPALKGGNGWIFPNFKKAKVEELIKQSEVSSVKTTSSQSLSISTTSTSSKQIKTPVSDTKQFVTTKEYLELLARVERLEQLVCHIDLNNIKIKSQNVQPNDIKEINENDESESEDDEEEKKPVQRLLRRKK